MSAKYLFVQMPSYRDKELIPTLVDLITNAKRPERLRIGICWQHSENEAIADFLSAGFIKQGQSSYKGFTLHKMSKNGCHLDIIDVNYLEAKGCGWARNIVEGLLSDSEYALQIDSHHRFVKDWDELLISMLFDLNAVDKNGVLTGYTPSYEPGNVNYKNNTIPTKSDFFRFSTPGIVRFKPVPIDGWREKTFPLRARFISGGFIFSKTRFFKDVPSNSEDFFATEEIVRSARAYCQGYNFYHPHRVIIWHYYKRDLDPKIWDDHTINLKLSGHIELSAIERSYIAEKMAYAFLGLSNEQSDNFLQEQKSFVRTISDYEKYCGICFSREAVTLEALKGYEPQESNRFVPEMDWIEKLIHVGKSEYEKFVD